MPKRKPNEEIFQDGDREISMIADFGFLESVNSFGRDVAVVYSDLSQGLMPPADIRNVLVSAVQLRDEENKKDFIESLITKYGLQECAIMASVMLSHAMIGDEKKSQIENQVRVEGALSALTSTQSENLKRLGLLWGAMFIASTVLACTISSFYVLHIA
jgi:hypothetical protein